MFYILQLQQHQKMPRKAPRKEKISEDLLERANGLTQVCRTVTFEHQATKQCSACARASVIHGGPFETGKIVLDESPLPRVLAKVTDYWTKRNRPARLFPATT